MAEVYGMFVRTYIRSLPRNCMNLVGATAARIALVLSYIPAKPQGWPDGCQIRVWTDGIAYPINRVSEEDIRKISFDFFHDHVDIPLVIFVSRFISHSALNIRWRSILKAGEEGYVNTHIIAPPGVFGYGDGSIRKFNPWLANYYVGRDMPGT